MSWSRHLRNLLFLWWNLLIPTLNVLLLEKWTMLWMDGISHYFLRWTYFIKNLKYQFTLTILVANLDSPDMFIVVLNTNSVDLVWPRSLLEDPCIIKMFMIWFVSHTNHDFLWSVVHYKIYLVLKMIKLVLKNIIIRFKYCAKVEEKEGI